MIVDDEILFDAFTPLNIFFGAMARYRGAKLGTMLVLAATFEVAENAATYYLRDHLPKGPDGPGRNFAMGLAATSLGWALADAGMRGAFSRGP